MEGIRRHKYSAELVRSGMRRVLKRKYNRRRDRCGGVVFIAI
jgi:hypothetical protein